MDETRTPRDVVGSYYEFVDKGAVDELVCLFAPDVVYDRPGHPRIEGRGALERFYRQVRPLSDGHHELHNVIADGNEVATRGTYRGRQEGDEVRLGFADFFRFDDENRVRFRYTYTDRDTV